MPIIILARLPTIKFMDSDFAEAIHFKVTCITKRSYNIDNVSTVESLLVNCARFSLTFTKYTIEKHILIGNCNYVSNKR